MRNCTARPIERVVIVGCGPGGEEYVTPAAKQAVEEADVVFGAKRVLGLFEDAQVEKVSIASPLEDTLAEIEERAGKGQKVAVLVTGDPGLRSLARPVIERLGRDRCRVVPGVSSVQAAFAAIGISWENARIVSAHHELPSVTPEDLRAEDRIAVLLGAEYAVEWTADLARKLSDHRCFVCENLTLEEERVREVDAEKLAEIDPPGRTVVILVRKELL